MSKIPHLESESRAAYSVKLHIRINDELFALAQDCLKRSFRDDTATDLFLTALRDKGIKRTPDGAAYSRRSVRLAMRALRGTA